MKEETKVTESTIQNAVIQSVSLGYEEGMFLTAYVNLVMAEGSQAFGGFVLSLTEDNPNYEMGMKNNITGLFVQKVLAVAGVMKWEMLPGRTVRIKGTPEKIEAIGHIFSDMWFNPAQEFASLKKKNEGADKKTPIIPEQEQSQKKNHKVAHKNQKVVEKQQ